MRARASTGFTLIEMALAVAVMAILVAVATPVIMQRIVDARIEATREEARNLYEAMVGRPDQSGGFGFVGDMGRLPASFQQLVQPSGLPMYATYTRGVGMGWKGPYINTGTSATDYLLDGFGRPYSGVATGQVRSTGPDGLDGTADDIVYPPNPAVISGRVHVTLKTVEDKKTLTDPAGYAVDLYYSNGGVEAVIRDSLPPFRFDNIPKGLHAILVVKLAAPNAGSIVTQETLVTRPGVTATELWF